MFVVTECVAFSRIQAVFDYRTLAQRIFKKITHLSTEHPFKIVN